MALNTNINVTATSSDVATGLEPGKRALKGLDDTARSTGKSLAGMGDGTDQSVQKIEQAAKRMGADIQRTTALLEAGAKGSVEYYKALANQRGISTDYLKPFLDKLDEVKVKQAQATAAMLSGAQSLDKVGMSAAATANALRGVPAQFTDIVTSIQGGQAPLTVFLQQGGQLKDMFGGAGNAAKALGGYVLGLINPYTLAAGAAAGLAIAYEAGAAESRAFNSALILSGNQAGVTTGQLMAMASSIDQISGTQGAAAEALALFAGSGKIGAENLEQFTLTAIRFEKVTGTAISDTVKKFEELRKAPLEATLKLNETMGYLTQTVYDQIKALTEQGRVTDAAALAQEEFNKATALMAGDMEKNLGTVQRSWMSVKSAVVETWDAIKGIGRDAGLEGQVAAAQKMVDIRKQAANSIYGNASDLVKLSEAENQLKGYQELLKNQQLSAKYAAERTESVKSQVEFDKESGKYLSKAVQMQQAIAAAQERFAKVSQTPENLARYAQEVEGIQKKFEESSKKSTAAIKENTDARRIQDERIRLSRALNTADGKAVEDANDAYKKMMDDLAKANDKYIESLNKSADSIAENVLKLSDEETALRISTEQNISLAQAIEGITIKRLEEKRVMELIGNNDAAAQAIAREIEQRKLLANAIDSKDARESVKKSAADAAAEWKRTSDQINSTLTDALMRGFESGKGFAKTLRDTVVNMFKTMVLRPIISAVMSPIAGAITGGLGLSGAASAATGVAGGAATGLAGTLAGFAATAASWGTAAGAGFMATLGGSTIAGGGAAGILATGGAAGASTAGSIGAAAPYALAAVAALAAFGAFRTTKKVGEGITGTLGGDNQSLNSFEEMRKSGYLFGGPKYWDELKALDATMAKAINTDFDAIKTAAKGAASALGLSADSVAGFSKAIRLTFTGDKTKDEAIYKEYMSGVSEDLARTIIGSYKDSIATVVDQIMVGERGDGSDITYSQVERQVTSTAYAPSEFARDGETASQTLARLAQSITLVNGTSDMLGNKLTEVSLKGANTASLLIDAFGGAERYAAQMGSYYQNFYTQEEQRAKLIENTSEAFTALGKTMPVLDGGARAAYRSMVELAAGQDMSVESNRTAYASLLALQGPMNELAPTFDSVAQAAKDAAEKAAALAESSAAAAAALAKTNQGWQDQLDVLTGAQTDRSIALRDAADDSTRAIMRQVYAQQDLKTASEAAAIALQGMIDAANSSKTSLADKYKNPLTLQSASAMLPVGVAEGLLGMSPTDVRTAIGGYISGLDPLTEAGRAAITQLAGLAPALDVLVAQVDSVAAAAAQAAANLPTFADGVNAAMSALKSSVDAQKTLVTDAYTAQSDSVRAALDTVTGSVGKLKSLSDSLKGTLDGLRVAGSDGEYRAAAQAQISAALAVARNSGTLPLDGQLTSALATVSKPSEALYGTFTDYARDFYKTANDIAALSDITGTQLTAEEVTQKILTNQLAALKAGFDAQIKALNSLADTAQAQVDAALGINSSVLSVTDALNNLAAALGVDSIASSAATSGSALGISKAQTRNGVAFAGTEAWRIGDLSYDSIGNAYMAYGPTGSNPGVYTSAQLEEMNHWAKGVINTWADTKNLPHFATGTNYVTADGPAYLHEGEAVVPRAYNPAAGGSDDTASALRAMADRLDRIEANTRATAGHTAGTDRKLARVIPGNALITEAVV